MPSPRLLSYEDSYRQIQQNHLDPDAIPKMPDRLPHCDDEGERGVRFFRTLISDDLSNLTLPRTFVGRSEVNTTSFKNSDLAESNFCWNDFIDVDFSDAILIRSDMRASDFFRTRFVSTDLTEADFRHSVFKDCDFTSAVMQGTILTRSQGKQLALSDTQRAEILWAEADGNEPDGG